MAVTGENRRSGAEASGRKPRLGAFVRRRWAVVVLAVLAGAAMLPALTGVPAHEWLGLAATAALLVHCGAHAWRLPALARRGGRLRLGAAVDCLVFASLALCAVSGLMVSATVLPAVGLFSPGYFFWDPLHSFSAKLLLAALLVHAFLHWRGLRAK